MKIEALSKMADKWPSTIVSRSSISDFTGGAISPNKLANLDCLGKGPKNSFRIGRNIVYPISDLITWLEERSSDPKEWEGKPNA